MFRNDSPPGNDTSSYAGSIQSNGYSFRDEVSSLVSSMSRPSAKSIYLQRKEYAASMNNTIKYFHYRVEHLLTCDLDGEELRGFTDCVDRLNLLDKMGRVWGQNMLLEVNGPDLLLTDTETKEVLESIHLCDIVELKAVLDTTASNSLLAVMVKPSRKRVMSVFLFHCDDVRADYVQRALSQARLSARHEEAQSHSQVEPKEWAPPDYNEDTDLVVAPRDVDDQEEEMHEEEEEEEASIREETLPPRRPYTELDRNVDILNHIINDIEIFMGKVAGVAAKNAKKKKKKNKGKVMVGMPPTEEFEECLQKIKCGFNLLVELKGKIDNPSVSEFVHCFFSSLAFIVAQCSEDVPPSIVAPLLTPQCICLMSEEASAEEDQLWQSLGDAWNIPSTKWPEDDEDIPTYTLAFFDGWQPPEVREAPAAATETPVKVQEVQRPPSSKTTTKKMPSPPATPTQLARIPVRYTAKLREKKLRRMRVMHDFISRNNRELTIRKGEVVELLDVSKLWWKVRNSRGEEGFVPNNVLTENEQQADDMVAAMPTGSSPVLGKKSKPAEVKAWLEHMGFTKITVRCLGVLSGSMLLSMTREELKTVCPEEGGRVFFQLQAVRSAALAAAN
ncbi:epidermal growth factor receptor kinase substrate 8-like protein 3 isoform X1 [Hippocampus zosterae]|uniref:epidermal growth factor receptor kinase substrate 8-like protein 3 isoform X1 n=1 Tax=Hippocampus zosterae TaxID=109293 RepID=UPI00223D9021|nr:epidermal growth factor receptor kinase substrate 8-like protein 3 isoform X1 [Hippocampus zosterae]XP_051932788.1 epidermal growth factor receptor kinase substrate 8-like protein 3 isoform X1 [Hippocampus zosterae]XP_051932789.1 epidermal growth factor receptor kinase substrate 8-like protein 3 isoform X1 [Hippocampus zosterae]